MTTTEEHIAALREALEAAQNALLYIAEQCERHPLYLGDDADEALIVEVGGDAATMTELAHQARAALIAAAHPAAIRALLDALDEASAALREAACALSLMQSYGHCQGDHEYGPDAAQVRAMGALKLVNAALTTTGA